jgi:CRISPR/Cas system-associated endoribonuclease Cas2
MSFQVSTLVAEAQPDKTVVLRIRLLPFDDSALLSIFIVPLNWEFSWMENERINRQKLRF